MSEESPHGLLLKKDFLGPKVARYVVSAPAIARRRRPGQFVIVRMHEGGERIPLTIADADPERGTITLIVQEVGKSTAEMAHLMKEPGYVDGVLHRGAERANEIALHHMGEIHRIVGILRP